MDDAQIIKRLNESKADQNLREAINEGRQFSANTDEDKQALERYEQMDESAKANFTNKGWKNG